MKNHVNKYKIVNDRRTIQGYRNVLSKGTKNRYEVSKKGSMMIELSLKKKKKKKGGGVKWYFSVQRLL